MKKMVFIFIVVVGSGLITSCSSMNSGFDCPNSAPGMCQSLDQINGMVDQGQIKGRTQQVGGQINYVPSSPQFQSYSASSNHVSLAPLRNHETVQRIWVAPFEDDEGNYHQDNLIYTVVKSGHWSLPTTDRQT